MTEPRPRLRKAAPDAPTPLSVPFPPGGTDAARSEPDVSVPDEPRAPQDEPRSPEHDGVEQDEVEAAHAEVQDDNAVVTPTAATVVREVERKLRIPALFRLPDLTAASGVARVEPVAGFTQTATYYDTDDLRLARWGVTLRRREGGVDDGWHLKLPVPGAHPGDRDEIQLPLDASPDGGVPRELTDIVTAFVRRAPLTAVATLRTERSPFLLYDPAGALVAELVDDVVSVLDGEVVAGRFREIEVESRGHDDTAIAPVVDLLIASGAEPGTTSKAVHALGPRATAPPDVPGPRALTPDDPAGEALRAHLLTHTRRLLLQDLRVRRGLPDAVHQMRVAARRLRSGLRSFRPLVDREWADALRGELAWVAGELGAIRDTEVMQERLDAHAARIPDPVLSSRARGVVDPALQERFASATAEALAALRSPRHLDLLDAIVEAAREPRFTDRAAEPGSTALPPLARKAWHELRRDADLLELDGPAEVWHEARIVAKRARYAAEAMVAVFGHPAVRLAEQLESVTELLGEHQDAHVARLTIRDLAERPGLDGLDGFALGMLHGLEDDAEVAARLRFARVWPKVVRAHRRTTLT